MTLRHENAISGKPWRRRMSGFLRLASYPASRIWYVRSSVSIYCSVMPAGSGSGEYGGAVILQLVAD